jgi:hypothetical protein
MERICWKKGWIMRPLQVWLFYTTCTVYSYLLLVLAFVLGERLDRAMVAYEQAHAWRELFALAMSERMEKEELLEICERVSGMFGILNTQHVT